MTTKPRSLPKLPRGDGSLSYDVERQQITLRYFLEGKQAIARADADLDAGAAIRQVKKIRDERRAAAAPAVNSFAARSDITITELVVDWLPFASDGKAPQTVDSYHWSSRLIVSKVGNLPAADLTTGHVERLLLGLSNDGLGAGSLSKLRAHLGLIVKHGINHHGLPVNVVAGTKVPTGAARPRAHRWLDADGFIAMRRHLAAEHSTLNAGLLTMLLCGLRPAEVIGLRWEAIDLDAGRLHVRAALRRHGAGRGTYRVTDELKTDHTGSKAARRTIPMPADLVAVLRRERTEQLARGRSEWVFAKADGAGGGVARAHFAGRWLEGGAAVAAEALGISYVNPVGYRHSFASMLVHGGMALPLVAQLLGHKNIAMLSKTYGHPMVDVPDTSAFLGAAAAS